MGHFSIQVIQDSQVHPQAPRLTTFLLTYPRYFHAEFMTHRSISRNAASSRAIPTKKQIEKVQSDPVTPLWWGKNQSGMQAYEELPDYAAMHAKMVWQAAAYNAAKTARSMEVLGVHKQYTNRVLEPFLPITVVATATEWANFFNLRVHEAAFPEFQLLAHLMLRAYVDSQPMAREWHLPFGDRTPGLELSERIKVAVARCARISYENHENGDISFEKDFELYERLLQSKHMSPFEHVAQATKWDESWLKFFGNFRGWVQHRKTLEGENQINLDAARLLDESEARLSVLLERIDLMEVFPALQELADLFDDKGYGLAQR